METLLLEDPSTGGRDSPGPLGVPMGVALDGILGGGVDPAYCARNSRALGDADIPIPIERLGELSRAAPGLWGLGLTMFKGFEGGDVLGVDIVQ